MECEIENCTEPRVGRGWCRKHYSRWDRTGDPEGFRRTYAAEIVCAHPECTNKIRQNRVAGRTRKYCSQTCYRTAGPKSRHYSERECDHCGSAYLPLGAKQRYCWTCLGGVVAQYPNGTRRYRATRLLKEYGMSAPEWDVLYAHHGGSCWLCRDRQAAVVDHDHSTGRVRGLLCSPCNTRLHHDVNEEWLMRAVEYLCATEVPVF